MNTNRNSNKDWVDYERDKGYWRGWQLSRQSHLICWQWQLNEKLHKWTRILNDVQIYNRYRYRYRYRKDYIDVDPNSSQILVLEMVEVQYSSKREFEDVGLKLISPTYELNDCCRYATSLSFRLLICKRGLITATSWGWYKITWHGI